MRQFLNSLYVTTQGAYLHCDGQSVDVRVEKESKLRIPIQTLSSIVCFGQVSCSPFLMALCADHGVKLAFLTENGKFLARVEGPVSGNVLLRRRQYRNADSAEQASSITYSIVLAKLANCRNVLLRGARDSAPESAAATALEHAAQRMAHLAAELKPASAVSELRGYEGEAAHTYFSVFDHLIVGDKEAFVFAKRSRRPPLDNVNALLSFAYTLLTHDTSAALETVGLDPAVGYLHVERPGRPSLALDLVEELRPVIADRLVLTLINRRQVSAAGFQRLETGGIVMNDDTRKELLVAYQKRKQEEIIHPYLNEKIPFGMIPFVQATLLARHLRGDLEAYPSFLWK
jgi:CRISPR-associated protein Cas1